MKNTAIMRPIVGLIIITGFIALPSYAYADVDQNGNVKIPPGMEVRRVGNVDVVVPHDGTVRQEEGRAFIEQADEYAARKCIDVEKRLTQLEEGQAFRIEEVARLKEAAKNTK